MTLYKNFDYLTHTRTNADRIRAMSDEELADSFGDGWGWGCELCPEYERLVKNGLCDGCCAKHCLEWLKQPVKEG